MKKFTIIVLSLALVASLMLVSCGKKTDDEKADTTAADVTDTAKADDTSKADDTADTTATDDTTSTEPVTITIASEDEIKNVDQMKDYAIDHADLSDVKAGEGGNIEGIWLSQIQKFATDMDNNPETTEYLQYRTAFTFRADGTGLAYIYMGPVELPFTYTLDNGKLTIKGDRLTMDNAKFTVSEDGQYLVFTSDQLSTNFMKIG